MTFFKRGATLRTSIAQMAELVDAPASGAGTGNGVGVRVPFWAPIFKVFMVNNQNYNIRLATQADADQLIDLQLEYEHYFTQLGCDSVTISKSERYKKLMEFAFSDAPFLQILIIEKNHDIIAYCTFYKLYVHEVPPCLTFYITSLYIKEQCRNSYLLFALFKKLVSLARQQKVNKIISSVWAENKPALSIYKRAGVKFFASEDEEHFWYLNLDDFENLPLSKRLDK